MIGRNKPSMAKKVKRVAVGGTVLAAAGYMAGLLTAPKSGKQTRQDIKRTANKSMADAEKELKKAHTELDKVLGEVNATGSKATSRTKKELDDLVTTAKDAKEKARELISAVREGEANDRDLKKAVKEANDAAKHLKDFLKSKPKSKPAARAKKPATRRKTTKK